MPEDNAAGYWANRDFPIAESPPRGAYQMAESMVMFDLRPASADEVAMSAQIDEIHDELARGIPTLQREMDELLLRVRRPGLA